jgi:hypothetical protein
MNLNGLGLYDLEEGRIEEADKFYQQLQEITDKIKKMITKFCQRGFKCQN